MTYRNPSESPGPTPVKRERFEHAGWTIDAASGPISGQRDLEAAAQALGSPPCLPEMLFASNHLTLTHEASGTQIRFDAVGALRAWLRNDLNALRVEKSSAWLAARQQDIARAQAVQLSYDWTYTTDYAGEVAKRGANGAACPQWQATAQQLDRDMLTERAPILFNANVPLYESEMDDHGVSACTVKLRVMPRCWFALLRFWLRVDGTLVRLREARVFCAAAAPHRVLRELKHSEGSYEELRGSGAPATNAAYQDEDAAAAALQAVAPIGLKMLQHEMLQLE